MTTTKWSPVTGQFITDFSGVRYGHPGVTADGRCARCGVRAYSLHGVLMCLGCFEVQPLESPDAYEVLDDGPIQGERAKRYLRDMARRKTT